VPRLKLTVRGEVQGVGFRWFVREAARRARVAGWVRNTADGAVEVRAAGRSDALAALLEAIRRGPPRARVDHVEQHTLEDDEPLPEPFIILH